MQQCSAWICSKNILNRRSTILFITIIRDWKPTTHIAIHFKKRTLLTANIEARTVPSFVLKKGFSKLVSSYTVSKHLASELSYPKLNPTNRQRAPHPHMVLPYQESVLVPDLGTDRIFMLNIDPNGRLKHSKTLKVQPGDGPRHAAVHSNDALIYVVNGLSRTLLVIRGPTKQDSKMEIESRYQSLDTDPTGTAAAIRLSEDNRFLYASVRLDTQEERRNGIIVSFMQYVDGRIGKRIGEWSSRGVHPRYFIIVEMLWIKGNCGSFISVANLVSDKVVLLGRDVRSGMVSGSALRIPVRTPTLILQF